MLTWFYVRTEHRINKMLRWFNLEMIADFDGNPPDKPITVSNIRFVSYDD